MKYTPGPWTVNYTKFSEVRTSDGAIVAKCTKLTTLTNMQANAALIAAAPELLAALEADEQAQKLYDEYLEMIDAKCPPNDCGEKWRAAMKQRKHAKELRTAAIAKAKGQAE